METCCGHLTKRPVHGLATHTCPRRCSMPGLVLSKPIQAQAAVRTATKTAPPTQEQQESSSFSWGNPLNGIKLAWPSTSSSSAAMQLAVQAPQAIEAAQVAKAAQQQQGHPLDASAFLGTCSSEELKTMRMLAHLCNQTYYMGQLTPSKMQRWHNLELVSTSLCCERLTFEVLPSAEEVGLEADGMAGPSLLDALSLYSGADASSPNSSSSGSSSADVITSSSSSSGRSSPTATAATLTSVNNVVPFPIKAIKAAGSPGGASPPSSPKAATEAVESVAALLSSLKRQQQQQGAGIGGASNGSAAQAAAVAAVAEASSSGALATTSSSSSKRGSSWNPADLVAAKLSEAAAAAAAAASAASAAASAAALQPLATAAGSLYAGSISLMSSVTSSVTATGLTSLTSGFGFTPAADRLLRETIAGITSAEIASSHPNSQAVKLASSSSGSKCPSEWFVADTPSGSVRYFVIQGSDSLDHWKTNLMFEPVPFEGPGSGIKVHRGAYEAAQVLYERFLPLVQEQVHRDPTAKVCFTGHSIGGAMAQLLMLMYCRRGILRPEQVAPVYTFGSPAFFCDGALGACSACITDPSTGAEACSLGSSLLSRLGLADDAIRSVMMTRDIVPRAFSCDYSLVADLLRSWGPAWKEHTCLAGGATGAGRRQLYVHIGRMHILQPSPDLPFITESSPHLPMLPQRPELFELMDRPSLSQSIAMARERAAAVRNGRPVGEPATSRDEVLAAVMDCPHPLDTLGDAGAYGTSGSISRYHNPLHYCMALGQLLRQRREEDAVMHGRAWVVPARAARHRPFFPDNSFPDNSSSLSLDAASC